ncbi:MAG TPA: hypothetical protein VGR53_02355 [Nitrososphaerales archaeon]|nr:hypothetical protein [Nitrososphaerales archaeon]
MYCPTGNVDLLNAPIGESYYMSPNFRKWGQVRFNERTERDRVYIDILKKRGNLTNVELQKAASEYPVFKEIKDYTRDKDVDIFVKRGEYLGILTRQSGKIQLLKTGTTIETPQMGQMILHPSGFITARAGLRCRHCMYLIDLSKVKIWRRIKSDTLLRILDVHHFFWVTCPNCNVKARYDMDKDVKEILANDLGQA